ncbi:MAG: NAD(P)-dependent oxidoreductase [Gammaproteobacteria bacterium]|nr:NAD(P)-dependent oxidoreductase [Gammaproteobacteria bacterium]
MSSSRSCQKEKIAFIGLGVMGYPMAGHLATAGYEVCVYNRTQEKARAWCDEYGGEPADSPAQAAADADVVFACVGNDNDVRSVTVHEHGAFARMQNGSLFVDHTTTSAALAQELARAAAARGIHFMDAPVSGGEVGARNGQLTVMLGGSKSDFARLRPVIASYAKAFELIGPTGDGQKAKMVNQICIAGLVQALAEGLKFAQAAELDVDKVIKAISQGAAQSWQMENRFASMVKGEFEFGFAVDWMRKDLGIALEEARNRGVSLPVTSIVDSFYEALQQRGHGRWDTSSLIALL